LGQGWPKKKKSKGRPSRKHSELGKNKGIGKKGPEENKTTDHVNCPLGTVSSHP
jgi:hypothetical protein